MPLGPDSLIALTAEIVSAFVSNNRLSSGEVPRLIDLTFGGAAGRPADTDDRPQEFTAAVSVRKSLASREHILSMIDGKPYSSLKRHLSSRGLTFEQYKARYGLPASYPSVAPGYSERRSEAAIARGLGRKPAAAPAAKQPNGQRKRGR